MDGEEGVGCGEGNKFERRVGWRFWGGGECECREKERGGG